MFIFLDGQEIILYHENGTFERLSNLLPRSSYPAHINSLSNQIKKLTCLTTTITNLQSSACLLQRTLNKIETFYQLNLKNCLKFMRNQWKLILNEQQLRTFQPNDFILILLCYLSSNDSKIYQLISKHNWIFQMNDLILTTYICQPILILRCHCRIHCQLGLQRIILPFEECIQEDEFSIETYFTNKFKSLKKTNLSTEQYHLAFTICNDAAQNFKSKLSERSCLEIRRLSFSIRFIRKFL